MEKQIVYKNIEQYGSQNATHKEFPSKHFPSKRMQKCGIVTAMID